MSKQKLKSKNIKSIDDWASERMSAYDVDAFENFCRSCGRSADQRVKKSAFENLLKLYEDLKSFGPL